MTKYVETALPFDNHRSTPMPAIGEFTRALHDTGVVDYLWLFDEFSGFFPGKLWSTDYTPAAEFVDVTSTYDPFVQGAFGLANNPEMSLRLTTDAVRSSPAELLRKILTLANGTNGKVVCAIGAGELRQTKPYGYKRSEGLKRLEDVFKLMRRLYDEPEPWTEET